MTHSLLERQLRKITDAQGQVDQEALLGLVNLAYEEYDRSLKVQSRATQLMSDELNELNAAIRRERDEAVAQSQKRFELAVEGTNDGIWDWNVKNDALWFSSRCKTMLGLRAESLKDTHIADWYGMVASEDREKAEALISEHLKWRMRGSATLRFNHASGEIRNIMFRATTVQDSTGQVARLVGIHTDITDLMKAQNELKAAKEAAEAANAAKSDFLTNMSHELRTPMHSILGFSRIGIKHLQDDKIDNDAVKAKLITMFSNIQVSGRRLLNLLNALLDLSKLDAGKADFDFVRDDLRKAIEQTLLEVDPLAQAKQVKIHVHGNNVPTTLPYDYKSMVQVFMNLLSNAVKFSPADSEVTVTLSEIPASITGGHSLLCAVADRGIGIPENETELVFDKFVQSSKTKSGAGGTGLGLAIARQIVEAHKGKIWVENIPQAGACFNLRLPY